LKIVVDTNIIFSLMLNSNTKLGNVFFNSKNNFKYYSCDYMRFEIEKHWSKLLNISKLSEKELQESKYAIYNRMKFINESLIPSHIWDESEKLINDIDEDDIDFIALSIFIKGYLWTGDMKLYNGLKEKKFKRIYNTNELLNILSM